VSKTAELVAAWRNMGPTAWAGSPFGWIDIDDQPIRLTPWQRAVLVAWEAHRDAVTTLAVSSIKKSGKTTVNAVLLCWRWLALPGEHFAVGNDFDQSAGRQFQMIADMVRRHPYLRRNVKATAKELLFTPTGSVIRALAVDAAGNAGANHLTASHTEAWGIVYEAGIRAFEELTPPPGRVYGLPALTPDGRLTEAAGMKAEHMLANDYFAHTSPQGVRPWEFLDQAGFPYRSAGENLALNYQNAYELIEDFMQSPSHRANLLSADFQEIGISIGAGELDGENALVAVFMFGKEQNAAD